MGSMFVVEQPVCVAVDQGNYNVKTYGPGTETAPFPTGVMHHGDAVPAVTEGTVCVNGKYYSITNDRLQARRDKTVDEDYFVLTLAGIANEIRAAFPDKDGYECKKVALALGLPVEHLSLKVNGKPLRDVYRSFFGNDGKPISFTADGIPFNITVIDVGVYAQTISAAISDPQSYAAMRRASRAYVVDIGGGTTNIISIIGGRPQNPGTTLENLGVLELFKMSHRSVMSECGRDVDDFLLDTFMQGKRPCPANIAAGIAQAQESFVKRLMLELEGRKVDLYMDHICFVGGGSVLLWHVLKQKFDDYGNQSVFIIPDVRANAKGYYAQESIKLKRDGIDVYHA